MFGSTVFVDRCCRRFIEDGGLDGPRRPVRASGAHPCSSLRNALAESLGGRVRGGSRRSREGGAPCHRLGGVGDTSPVRKRTGVDGRHGAAYGEDDLVRSAVRLDGLRRGHPGADPSGRRCLLRRIIAGGTPARLRLRSDRHPLGRQLQSTQAGCRGDTILIGSAPAHRVERAELFVDLSGRPDDLEPFDRFDRQLRETGRSTVRVRVGEAVVLEARHPIQFAGFLFGRFGPDLGRRVCFGICVGPGDGSEPRRLGPLHQVVPIVGRSFSPGLAGPNRCLIGRREIGGVLTDPVIDDLFVRRRVRAGRRRRRRLGVLITRNGVEHHINRSPLDAMVRRIEDGLGYGPGTHPHLDPDERTRRERVITRFSDALLDVFNEDFTSSVYALDASGMWTWGKARTRPPKQTNSDNGDNGEEEFDDEEEGDDPASAADTSRQVGPTRYESDPDARWGRKTSKYGKHEDVFGYHLHALARVPGRTADRHAQAVDAEPRLVHRIGITPANADVVAVSLDMFDRLNTPEHPARITDVIVDKHYHYKTVDRWLAALYARGIRQHHDLRKKEARFIPYLGMRFFAGHAHCPATPDELGNVQPLPVNADPSTIETFITLTDRRHKFAMTQHTAVNADREVRYVCPAVDGKIGCPRKPGTVQRAIEQGDQIADPTLIPDGITPLCCTQPTFTVTLLEPIFKLAQHHYWGSKKWRREYNKRSYVESLFGNLKNDATENLSRKLHRHVGITMNHIHITLTNVNYNLRTLRAWHANTGKGNPDNPLLAGITPNTNKPEPIKRGPRLSRWKTEEDDNATTTTAEAS